MKTTVTTKKFGDVKALVYRYGAGEMEYEYHMLCEVGAMWQPEAKSLALELADKRGCDIKTVELDTYPWVVDALVKREEVT